MRGSIFARLMSVFSSRRVARRPPDRDGHALAASAVIANTLAEGQRRTLGRRISSRAMLRLGASVDAELALAGKGGSVVLLVVGAEKGEGATSTSLGLALSAAAAEPRRRVLLIDADDGSAQLALGIPADHAGFSNLMGDGSNQPLSNVLVGTAQPNLQVLPCGSEGEIHRVRLSPLSRVLDEAKEDFDLVIIDAPGLLEEASARVLAQGCGNVVLVVRKASLPTTRIAQAIEHVRRSGATLLGCAISGASEDDRREASP